MHSPFPLTRDLVLAGGGHAHALLLRRWGMNPLPGARLTLVSPAPTAPYTGMLPGALAGHFPASALEIDLIRLCRFSGARFVQGELSGLDLSRAEVHLSTGRRLRYDRLSLNVGVIALAPDVPGFAEHVVSARPMAHLLTRWQAFLDRLTPGQHPRLVVIGAGVGGVELALALDHRLKSLGHAPAAVTLVDRAQAMPDLSTAARAHMERALKDAGVALKLNTGVAAVEADAVRLEDGTRLEADLILGTTGARPHDWLQGSGLDLTNGFVTVDDQLRSRSDPAVYAAGDCAHLSHDPRPKAGVYAVRAAPVLAHNLAADLSGGGRRRFRPQGDFLRLMGTGPAEAVAAKWGLALRGAWAWRWKMAIDRRFMDRLGADLKPMRPPAPPARVAKGVRDHLSAPPPCAGCGSKVGQSTLQAALDGLPVKSRADVIAAPGDDAALVEVNGHHLALSTDHLRAFSQDEVLFAQVAAEHALNDIYAMGAAPQLALASVTLPPMAPEMQADTLRRLMRAAEGRLHAAGATLAGGHTAEGSELSLGFTVTGNLDQPAIGLGGARPGDVLILTKPLGSGTILAAEMAMRAQGPQVTAAWAQMLVSQQAAARILRQARAMTDVTGFGLAGHLANICRASGTGATISLAQVPLLPGAEEAAAAGVRSSLYAQNRASVPEFQGSGNTPAEALLFDPQTSGGLLAAVDPAEAETLIAALRADGYEEAALIGALTDRPGQISPG